MQEIYLDNSATTRPLPEVVEAMTNVLTDNYGNPSSLHNKGLEAERILKQARKLLAGKLKVKEKEIVFTSGGTESNNLAIKGIAYNYQNRGKHLITTSVEHASVLETFRELEREGFDVTYLQTDRQGKINIKDLEKALTRETILVSIIHVNNELGTINPISKIGPLIKAKNSRTYFHVDAVQSLGKVYLNPGQWQVDLLTVSAHKIHGPKGIGALYIREGIEIKPLLHGGGQEKGIRSGTENLPGIAGFIPALKAIPNFSSNQQKDRKLDRLKKDLIKKIKEKIPGAKINSPVDGAPHIINVSFPGARGEVLVHALESKTIYVSTGSACHSRKNEKSHVLRNIGLSPEEVDGTIRISLSHFNTKEDLSTAVDIIAEQLEILF